MEQKKRIKLVMDMHTSRDTVRARMRAHMYMCVSDKRFRFILVRRRIT